jgi:hypothetical protein
LELANIQPADAGEYSVAVTNVAGYTISQPARLDFIPLAFTQQPAGGYIQEGGSWQFHVDVDGTRPYQFQWYHNDTPVPDATDAELTLAGLELEDGGDYFVRVSNPLETVTSETVTLTFLQDIPVEIAEIVYDRETDLLKFVVEGEPGVKAVLQFSVDLHIWFDFYTEEMTEERFILQFNAGSFERIFVRARIEPVNAQGSN